MVSGARELVGRDPIRRTLAAAMILGLLLAGALGREGPTAAQAQSPGQQDATQTPPDEVPVTGVSPGSPDASRLLQKAEREGSVRAIVGLRTDFVPEGQLNRSQIADQRDGIDNARAGLQADLAGTGYRTLREYETVPYVALTLTPQSFRALQNSPRVSSITEDVAVPPALAESTGIVNAPTMWENGYTGAGQTIAVLDTGVDGTHPFLAGKVVEEACYSTSSDCPNGQMSQTGAGAGVPCAYAPEGCEHGTHVAGIAAGQGNDFSGVARDANIMSIQVSSQATGMACNGGEDPCTTTFTSDHIAGLERVYQLRDTHAFAAVNMSLGGGQFFDNCDTDPRKAAIDNLRSEGIATVVSSMNNGYTNAMAAPACISSAVSVGSTTDADEVSVFSNSASFLSLLAPGDGINSSVPGGGFEVKNGTSMAAPHVAGAWAILEQQDPASDVSGILSALQRSGTSVPDDRPGGQFTKRRINIADVATGGSNFTVNSIGDGEDATPNQCETVNPGECTLRAAIQEANKTPTKDRINFDIPGSGVKTIKPDSELPAITSPVTIDGYSQPGASANTNLPDKGTNAVLLIEIDSTNTPTNTTAEARGLHITGGGTTVRGLVINTDGFGIDINTAGGNTIAGNFIGTDPTGTIHRPVNNAIRVLAGNNTIGGTAPTDRNLLNGAQGVTNGTLTFASSGFSNPCPCSGNLVQGNLIGTNAVGTSSLGSVVGIKFLNGDGNSATIGGTTSAARNVISGHDPGVGIEIQASSTSGSPTIQGNYIGTDVTGTVAIGNGGGIDISSSSNIAIGGTEPGAGNLISGNRTWGLRSDPFSGPATNNVIQGNLIGTTENGKDNLGNGREGILLVTPQNATNLVGGTVKGAGNTVAFNGEEGVNVHSGSTAVLGNSIFSNAGLGINLGNDFVTANDTDDPDVGANDLQNFPVLTSASVSDGNATVSGTLNSTPDTMYRLELFTNAACNAAAPNDYGEGQTYIGTANITTDSGGDASFGPLSFPVPAGRSVITATATDPDGNTSEFSRCLSATTNSPPTAQVDSYATDEDTQLTVDAPGVLANDSDPNNDPLTAVKVSDPAHGTLTLNANGSLAYTPNAGFSGTDTFTYRANDGVADSNTATVTITVNQGNDPPAANDDTYAFTKGNTLSVPAASGVLTNDTDPNGDNLTARLVTGPSMGTLTLNPDGSFAYTKPKKGFQGVTFVYEASDGNGGTDRATVTIRSKGR